MINKFSFSVLLTVVIATSAVAAPKRARELDSSHDQASKRQRRIDARLEIKAFIKACKAGDLEQVTQMYLRNPALIHAYSLYTESYYQTGLMVAVKYRRATVIQYLLEKGADVNQWDREYRTSLTLASENGDLNSVKALLDRGAKIDVDFPSNSALVLASENGHIEVVRHLLTYRIEGVNEEINKSLVKAATRGHLEIVKLLVASGANINYSSGTYGTTALAGASCMGHIEIVRYLLESAAAEAGINQGTTRYGWTPLMSASIARTFNRVLVELLIRKGASVNQTDTSGTTALIAAADVGNKEAVEILLENGALVDQANGSGKTALYQASQSGHLDVVNLLLEKGASVNQAETSIGMTPLMAAVWGNHYEVENALLEHGADVNITTQPDQVSALSIAAQKGTEEILSSLFAYPVKPNATIIDLAVRWALVDTAYLPIRTRGWAIQKIYELVSRCKRESIVQSCQAPQAVADVIEQYTR